jgi:phage shock protein E
MTKRSVVIAVRACSLALLLGACSKSERPAPAPAAATQPAATQPATTQPTAKGPDDARSLIAAGAVVIDVRTTGEYADGHLPNATNIPVEEMSTRLDEVAKLTGNDKTRPIVVYCESGSRASNAKRQLDTIGYSRVVNGGGLDDLQ